MKKGFVQSVWAVKIASNTKVLVKKGQLVEKGNILAISKRRRIKLLAFPNWLKAKKGIWKEGGRKKPGEELVKGETIYEQKNFFRQRSWISPYRGKIEFIDEENGVLKIILRGKTRQLLSPTNGKVTAVSSSGIKLVFLAQRIAGEGVGKKRNWGRLDVSSANRSFFSVNWRSKGKILVVEEITFPILEKCFAMGVAGLVGFSFPERRLADGPINLPVLLFADQGSIKQREIKRKLKEFAGSQCFLDAAGGQLLVCRS